VPKTATQLRLEKLLDGKSSSSSSTKRSKSQHKAPTEASNLPTLSNNNSSNSSNSNNVNTWSRVTTSTSSNSNNASSNPLSSFGVLGRHQSLSSSVLAPRGKLSDAPSFRAKKIIPSNDGLLINKSNSKKKRQQTTSTAEPKVQLPLQSAAEAEAEARRATTACKENNMPFLKEKPLPKITSPSAPTTTNAATTSKEPGMSIPTQRPPPTAEEGSPELAPVVFPPIAKLNASSSSGATSGGGASSLRLGLSKSKSKRSASRFTSGTYNHTAAVLAPTTVSPAEEESSSDLMVLPMPTMRMAVAEETTMTTTTKTADSNNNLIFTHKRSEPLVRTEIQKPTTIGWVPSTTKATSSLLLAPDISTFNLQSTTNTKKRMTKPNNDNFVRLNMKNGAGACRGARNKSGKSSRRFQKNGNRTASWKVKYQADDDNSDGENDNGRGGPAVAAYSSTKAPAMNSRNAPTSQGMSRMTGLDPVDDYLDGVFQPPKPKEKDSGKNAAGTASTLKPQQEPPPKCARHQRPCNLLVVKKNTTGNKGRKFYACGMPRGEQCNHFQWADDTIEASSVSFRCYTRLLSNNNNLLRLDPIVFLTRTPCCSFFWIPPLFCFLRTYRRLEWHCSKTLRTRVSLQGK
jgi:hypothetical protein